MIFTLTLLRHDRLLLLYKGYLLIIGNFSLLLKQRQTYKSELKLSICLVTVFLYCIVLYCICMYEGCSSNSVNGHLCLTITCFKFFYRLICQKAAPVFYSLASVKYLTVYVRPLHPLSVCL